MRHATYRRLVIDDQDAGSVPDIRERHVSESIPVRENKKPAKDT
jgi:hypothetical protein